MDRSTACLDWAERLREGRSIIPPPLYPAEAQRGLDVFKSLRIVDAPGSPTFGESCDQWVFDLVASIFGAYNPDTGQREITEWFVLVPKKNSKSTIAAGIMLTALILNWRNSAEFVILAPTKEVADNAFTPARDMIRHDEDLTTLTQLQTHIRTITHRNSTATLKVVAADSDTVGGKKSVGTLIDEVWLFGKKSDAEDMFREATGGIASRDEGFVIYLSTQSNEPPAGVFRQRLQYARDVRDGVVKDHKFVPVLYEFPQEMIDAKEHLDEVNWYMVNPNMGYSVNKDYLIREYAKAQVGGDESLRGFLAKHLNIEVGLALRSDRWAGADEWEACGTERTLSLSELIERCEVIVIGIDGGGLDDLLGMTVLGRERGGRNWLSWSHAWAHPSVLERRKSEAPLLKDLQRAGDLTIVNRVGEDIEDVVAICKAVFDVGLLDKIGLDPAGIGAILDSLEAEEIPQDMAVGISQGWRLGGAIKTTERRLAEGTLLHANQQIMAWCVSNARVEPRGNAILITKQASGTGKIDPLMALFNAVSLMSLNPDSKSGMDDYLESGFFGLIG